MDLNIIKNKLSELNSKSQQKEKVDYSSLFWKPTTGKHQIRIIPSKYNPSYPFSELKFHYGIGKYPMIALSNFGKQDPVEEFVQELKKTSDSDNWKLAGRLTPKTRIFAPIVVRGEEEKGVRLWGFGKTIYKSLLALAEDEDIGDYTDVINGFDMIVEKVESNPYPETTIRIKPKMSPLSDNNELVESWLEDQPDPKDTFTQYDYGFIKTQLQNMLNPSEDTSTPSTDDEEDGLVIGSLSREEDDEDKPFVLKQNTANTEKKDVVSKFDDLFD